MSPLAALVEGFLGPILLVAVLFCEWWSNWFVLGRDFTRTGMLTLVSNLLSHGLGQLLLAAGALGLVEGEAEPLAWIMAGGALYLAHLGIESLCIARIMRRWRPRWNWNRYDFTVFAAAQAAGFFGLALKSIW